MHLCLKRDIVSSPQQIVMQQPPMSMVTPAVMHAASTPEPVATNAPGAEAAFAEKVTIDSPIVGTFYRASNPKAKPFVKTGDKVEPDTIVCVIEAMKVMNEIKAEKSGVIKEILVENAQSVEYGCPLFVIE